MFTVVNEEGKFLKSLDSQGQVQWTNDILEADKFCSSDAAFTMAETVNGDVLTIN